MYNNRPMLKIYVYTPLSGTRKKGIDVPQDDDNLPHAAQGILLLT